MSEHYFAKHIKGFHYTSYLAGVNATFAEVVSAGCKKLALSSPLTEEQFEAVRHATEEAAEEYNVCLYVERELLVTLMFPRDIAKNKIVILIAHDEGVLREYLDLKAYKMRHIESGTLTREVEVEIAHRFGKLLSYDDGSIMRLLMKWG